MIVGAFSSKGGEGDAGKAWRAAWHEVTDSAWDAGIRWRTSDSDTVIAYAITQYCVQRNTDVWHSQYGDDICAISAAAASTAFGGAPKMDDGLWDCVERVREALHTSRIRQLFRRHGENRVSLFLIDAACWHSGGCSKNIGK